METLNYQSTKQERKLYKAESLPYSKAELAGAKRNRSMIAERRNTLGYVQHEIALRDWDGELDENWQPPSRVRLGEVPHIKGK